MIDLFDGLKKQKLFPRSTSQPDTTNFDWVQEPMRDSRGLSNSVHPSPSPSPTFANCSEPQQLFRSLLLGFQVDLDLGSIQKAWLASANTFSLAKSRSKYLYFKITNTCCSSIITSSTIFNMH